MMNTQKQIYQAIAFLPGLVVKDEEDKYSLLTQHGQITVSGMSKRLKYWLSRNPDRATGLFICYPRVNTDAAIESVYLHSFCNYSINVPTQFRIAGRVIYQLDGKIAISIKRNVAAPEGMEQFKAFKPFKITLNGELPEMAIGAFWSVDAEVQDGKLTIVNAVKVADRIPPSKKPIKRSDLIQEVA